MMYADRVSAAPRGRRLYLCLDLVTAPDRDAAPPHPDVHYRPTLTSGSGMYEVVPFSDSKAMFTLLHLKVEFMSARVIEVAANPAVRPILWRLINDLVVCRKDIRVNGSMNEDVIIFYTRGEDCSSACTDCQRGNDLFELCVQPLAVHFSVSAPRACCNCLWNSKGSNCSFVSSRPAPQEPVNVPSHDEMPPPSAAKPPPSCTPAKRPRASSHALPPPKPPLFTLFKSTAVVNPGPFPAAFSPRTQAHRYVGLPASLSVHELSAVRQALREAETCVIILRSRVAALESIEDVDF
ncbi:hypothetical protein AJ78_08911 [Emergomyces pasteurianus Ep9510]|uniref:Uncharacterized protein n=1 Tax=Emergomyces pasteurianus Ep9510 TaxID=1447872 RepID=A0A1J9P0S3_9EURO|nr:hypothetical protein AJ78_08911 [Emergomyces pasteurianus Ep9510]